MSEARWELNVEATAAENYEAMTTAGRAALGGKQRALLIFQSVFIGFTAPIGATMFLFVLLGAFGGATYSDVPKFVMLVAYVVFVLLTTWLARQAYVIVAHMTVASRFGRRQLITLDALGITLVTDHSRWHSGWADVELVCGAKNVLVVGISGIAIPIPRRAFLGPRDADDALETMQRWQAAAR